MSKIICDVCGTSYPETASQCPICGCVRPGDAQIVASDTVDSEAAAAGGYTYVKGGRFSKANVRKRNRTAQNGGYEPEVKPNRRDDEEKKSNKGLIITAVILLIAIIAVLIYIILHFFTPGTSDNKNKDTTGSTSSSVQDSTPPINLEIPCEGLTLDVSSVTLDKQGSARMVYATPSPADTTDKVTYSSSDESVATVSADGKITAVAPGQAIITVKCGDITKECIVDCAFADPTADSTEETVEDTTAPAEEFKLNRFDITFSKKGDSWMIYSGNVGLTEITWTSDDDSIATIENGKVVAVGSGTTNVHGEYNGQKASCIIRCSFDDGSEDPTISGSGGGVTEDGGGSSSAGGPYRLYNIYGNAEDVSISVGQSFTLKLVDSANNAVSGVTWSVSDSGKCSVSNGNITGLASGTVTVTATYQGVSYECIVRIS